MTMSRKHYETIADLINTVMSETGETDAIRDMADGLTEMFEADNPRFDRRRFMIAAGFDVA